MAQPRDGSLAARPALQPGLPPLPQPGQRPLLHRPEPVPGELRWTGGDVRAHPEEQLVDVRSAAQRPAWVPLPPAPLLLLTCLHARSPLCVRPAGDALGVVRLRLARPGPLRPCRLPRPVSPGGGAQPPPPGDAARALPRCVCVCVCACAWAYACACLERGSGCERVGDSEQRWVRCSCACMLSLLPPPLLCRNGPLLPRAALPVRLPLQHARWGGPPAADSTLLCKGSVAWQPCVPPGLRGDGLLRSPALCHPPWYHS